LEDNIGQTPLHIACINLQVEVAHYHLLRYNNIKELWRNDKKSNYCNHFTDNFSY